MDNNVSVQDAFSSIVAAEALQAGGISALAGKLATNNYQIQNKNLQLLNGALQFNGLRDVFLSGGWKPSGTDMKTIAAMGPFYYKRVGTANTIISKPPAWTWRRGIEIRSEVTGFADLANQVLKNLQLVTKMGRADKLSRIGRYGLLLLVHADVATGQEAIWRVPVSPNSKILDAKPIMEESVQSIVPNPTDGGLSYSIKYKPAGKAEESAASRTIIVHSSRVIHIADNQDESSFYGTPVIAPILNDLDDLLKIAASSGEAFWRYRGTFILQQAMDKEGRPIGFTSDDEKTALMDAFRDYFYGLYSTMILSNVDPKQIADEPVSPKEWQAAVYERIATGINWPMRILRGSETGERASEGDAEQFATDIEARQTNHAAPNIVRPIITALIYSGQLPDPGEVGYSVYFPPVLIETEEQRTKAAETMSKINKDSVATTGVPVFSDKEVRVRLGSPAEIPEDLV